jgi:hypothetical protein
MTGFQTPASGILIEVDEEILREVGRNEISTIHFINS